MICKNCGSPVDDWMKVCPNCQANIDDPGEEKVEIRLDELNTEQNTYSLGWYHVLIRFFLYAIAVLNALSSLVYFLGIPYGEFKDIVYEVYPMLNVVNIIYGFVALGIAALCIFARQALAHRKKSGPALFYSIYITSVVSNILLFILSHIIITDTTIEYGDTVLTLIEGNVISLMSSAAFAIFMIAANRVYFKKRASMFVN